MQRTVADCVEIVAILFAPTGPMQEVSLSSGWRQEFLVLAERFDGAMVADDPQE